MSGVAPIADPPWEEVHASLRAFIGRRVRNPADVDDLVQRVLLRLVRGLGSLRDRERLHAWVYRTARNVIADHYRSAPVRRERPGGDAADLDALSPHAEGRVDDEEPAAVRELASCLTPLLDRLPAPYREALVLTELEGRPQADAARLAGVSLSGMKSRVQRGRRQLRAALEACCRVDLDRRGGVMARTPRAGEACATRCDPCGPEPGDP